MNVRQPKPAWLRRRLPGTSEPMRLGGMLEKLCLHTVCQEARCPNQMDCFNQGTATFLLLGPSCTRRCTFCAVDKTPVKPVDPGEPDRVAQAVAQMNLDFCVLTMVTRDDLPDGGAALVARTIRAVRQVKPGLGVEVLISDLGGDETALEMILSAEPQVLNHNLETVPRLYPAVRPQADFRRSLQLLSRAAKFLPRPATKSGLMLGLGESQPEVLATLDDLLLAGCDLLTLGQYLAPSDQHHPIVRFVTPQEFDDLKEIALAKGFKGVASGPLVRSSFQAADLYRQVG